MTKKIDNNTTSNTSTNFLRAVELINCGMSENNLASENWAYPTTYKHGSPSDKYYAEIWHNGMDWNSVYWLIEESNYENPKIYPLFYFIDSDDRARYCNMDFGELCKAIMDYRRETLWIKSDDPTNYGLDSVWPYISKIIPENRLEICTSMVKYKIEHASQESVEFYINEDLMPKLESSRKFNECNISSEFPRNKELDGVGIK